MTDKQKLLLLLIKSDHNLWSVYNLIKAFDRMNFPAKISENLEPLIENGFIRIHTLFDNGTVSGYIATEKGKEYVFNHVNVDAIKIYVLKFEDARMILSFIDSILARNKGT